MRHEPDDLIVDDEAAIQDFLSEALTQEGYTTLTAENGAVALQMVEQYVPDLLLVDMRMPVMDGWTFLHHCCRWPAPTAPSI